MSTEACPGVRSPLNPASRVPCCRACATFDLLAPGAPGPALHDGTRWVCASQVPVVTPALKT